MSRTVPRWVATVARVVFALAGVGFLAWAFLATWERSEGLPLAPWPRMALAVALGSLGLTFAVRAWAALLQVRVTRGLAWGFFLSQLGKYVPGGVWQAVGQVGYASRVVSPTRATGAFAVFTFVQAAAGGTAGAFVALFAVELAWPLRLLALAGPSLLLILRRAWMLRAVRAYARFRRQDDLDPTEVVPSGPAIRRSTLWTALVHLALGLGFALVLPEPWTPETVLLATVAFPLAWTVGFLALPFPAGLGIREAVLIALLPATTAAVIAASVAYRLVLMASEVVMMATARWIWPADVP